MSRRILSSTIRLLTVLTIPLLLASCASQKNCLDNSFDDLYNMAYSPRKLYVAPNGNDAWSGSLKTPNHTLTDGPFKTLLRAKREIAAELRNTSRPFSGADVIIIDAKNQEKTLKFR